MLRSQICVQVRQVGDKTPSAAVLQTFGWFATATSVPTRHSPVMREMSVTEQRYKAVLAVIADGRTVGEGGQGFVASRCREPAIWVKPTVYDAGNTHRCRDRPSRAITT